MSDSTPTLERVARAIAAAEWKRNARMRQIAPDPQDTAQKYAERSWGLWEEHARAALDASGNDELLEAARFARNIINPHFNAVHKRAVERLDAAIARTQEPRLTAEQADEHSGFCATKRGLKCDCHFFARTQEQSDG